MTSISYFHGDLTANLFKPGIDVDGDQQSSPATFTGGTVDMFVGKL